ncbi:hypothetical protein [Halarsenatibacter silvermanii]|uniref:Uncharacterized protein n=1 Tax=Halarsenatibacter silvermanii TaxID=321763 RepID=A0A1G9U730_9FIRM|nr:hypothetical protein [Halarsenatibacter silvermanii]SDM55741.1 hypothetical protein SAMN04488692_1624 [Halarsenatibacter silvermanii]
MPYCFGWFFPLIFFGFFIYIFFFRRGGSPFQPPWNDREERYREKSPEENYSGNTDEKIELRKKVVELEKEIEYLNRRLEEEREK